MSEKRFVRYSEVSFFGAQDPTGLSIYIFPVDHLDTERVSNTKWARTSPVVAYDETMGIIETGNTVYVPV